jgi:hypothetical protein
LAKAKPETASSQLVTLIEAPLPWFQNNRIANLFMFMVKSSSSTQYFLWLQELKPYQAFFFTLLLRHINGYTAGLGNSLKTHLIYPMPQLN